MPRFAEIITPSVLDIPDDQLQKLEAYLNTEIEDAFSARHFQDERWLDDLRRYDAIPKNPAQARPIEGRIPIEVALGAIATDAIYAQELALIFGISPIITVRATNSQFTEHAKAVQRFSNFIVENSEFNLREAVEEALLDKNKLGTGFYYIPWTERIKRTRTRKVRFAGPRIRPIPPEDCIAPGGATANIAELPWIGIRLWLNSAELAEYKSDGWDVEAAKVAANVDQVRQQRERLGQTHGETKRAGDLYEIILVWCDWDINDDGFAEALVVAYDRTARCALKIDYEPYDHRPIEIMRYLRRGHLFYGRGVMDITRPNQEMATDIMNNWLDNAYLANVRMWISSPEAGLGGTLHAWPGRNIQSSDPDGVKPLQLADVYSSMPQLFLANQQLTERRTGVNELTQSPLAALGSRTPGITALSALQSQNQRFTAVFDSGRIGTAGAVKQCLYRFKERVLAGDGQVEAYIRDILGDGEAALVIEVMRSEGFEEAFAVELTASSASINKDADRQNALALANLLGTYYTRTIELITLSSSPEAPDAVKEVAKKVAVASGEIIERTIRTFDQVRDPEAFIIDIERELNNLQQQGIGQEVIAKLMQALAAGAGGGGRVSNGIIAPAEVPFAGTQSF